jgi:hypothetical protein
MRCREAGRLGGNDVIEDGVTRGMPRRRRLAAVAALGLLAAGVLAGCRSEPGAAVFVGNTRITNQQIDTGANSISGPSTSRDTILEAYVTDLTFIALAERYAADHKITLKEVQPAELAQEAQQVEASGLTLSGGATNPVLKALSQASSDFQTLIQAAPAAAPTDADLMEIYNRAKAGGLTTDTFEHDRTAIAQIQGIGQAIGLRNELTKSAQKYAVKVNPRYLPTPVAGELDNGLEYPILQLQGQQGTGGVTVLALPLGGAGASPAVVTGPNAPDSGTADNTAP